MARFIQKGADIDYKNTGVTAIAYGDVVVLGKQIAIANCNIPVGGVGTVSLEGIYEVKANTIAFGVGDTLYWDVATSELTKTATGGVVAGICVEDKAAAVLVAKVRL